MRKYLIAFAALVMGSGTANAVDSNTVEIVYNGSTATVTVASNISSYITDASNGSSHVKLTQSDNFTGNTIGEITYILSGTSTDGEFYLEGSYKCSVELNGVTLTNPAGPAVNIQNGKRIKVSAKNGTTSTLTDGQNDNYNGCLHSKGHTEFKGKGTINVVGNSKHAIYSKEYMQVKNLTINITAAQKDGIHCKEYFLIEGGSVNISGVADDGIQVELDNGSATTGTTSDHEDENSGNFYMTDGSLAISNYSGKAIKADGSIKYNGGTRNYDTSDVTENAASGISHTQNDVEAITRRYNLQGRSATTGTSVIIEKNSKRTIKKLNRK
jgi:hypothetical protein